MDREIVANFKNILTEENPEISDRTLVNYFSDLRHFINWHVKVIKKDFIPEEVTSDIVKLYSQSKGGVIENGILDNSTQLSESSVKRHLSTLRKFFSLLYSRGALDKNPFDDFKTKLSADSKSKWRIEDFKKYLLKGDASKVTVKNYLSDISNFTRWYEENLKKGTFEQINRTPEKTYYIDQDIVDKYKNSLTGTADISPRTINRKLSSIRKYFAFAMKIGLLNNIDIKILNVKID